MQGLREISILEIAKILLKRLWFIIIIAVLCAVGAFVYTRTFVDPMYMTSASLYVTNGAQVSQNNSVNLNDINASVKLVDSYIVVLQSDSVAEQIKEISKLDYSKAQIKSMIKLSSLNETQALEVRVTCKSREDAVTIANTMLEVAPETLKRVAKVGEVETLDPADDTVQVSPNIINNTLIGFLLGLVLSVLVVLLQAMLDRTIKGEEDLSTHYEIAVLGSVPDFRSMDKGGYKR